MSGNYNELIEEAREHRPSEDAIDCVVCCWAWPCLEARLVTALEQSHATWAGAVNSHAAYISDTTNAALRLVSEKEALRIRALKAEARAALLVGYTQHRPACLAEAWGALGPCDCGLSVALGLAGESSEEFVKFCPPCNAAYRGQRCAHCGYEEDTRG